MAWAVTMLWSSKVGVSHALCSLLDEFLAVTFVFIYFIPKETLATSDQTYICYSFPLLSVFFLNCSGLVCIHAKLFERSLYEKESRRNTFCFLNKILE